MTKRELPWRTPAKWAAPAFALLAMALFANRSPAELAKPPRARNVVLVHGAWADGSSAVSKLDQTISPDLERALAARMKATTIELAAGHLSLLSHSREIADLIMNAAGRAP